ncbi:hypothetical protein NM208_g10274 [Fusarium decemcellulare]|uniref:Uncharacterized protein n=1 Tax=Fusarium decemcellulare TaxID=57161 RepID=A0ACC1RYL4_9HYPO|nr:hypothetical protein NM208_g10274 [Fusarium decemcellulare]
MASANGREMDSPTGVQTVWLGQLASLELLPPEILLPIVTNLPGLDMLWNLMRASPQVWRVFDSHALAIVEGILSGPNSILAPSIRQLVRGVILARSGALPFRNLEEYHLRFMRGQAPWTRRDQVFISLGPETLSNPNVSVTALRSTVATAYQLSALSQACLASALARLRDPSFKPMHALDPMPHYTWVEEMRALRAMWFIQLAGEVKHLVTDNTGTTGWLKQDAESLSKMGPLNLIENQNEEWIISRGEEVKSAMQYLKTLRDATKDMYYRLPRPPPASPSVRWETALPKLNERTTVIRGFRRDGRVHWIWERPYVLTKDEKPVYLPTDNDACRWGQTECSLKREAPGLERFRSVTAWNHASPIPGVKFDSLRPFGFAFWDKLRVHQLGLTDGLDWPYFEPEFYFFAWESIIPVEEVASLKAALREERRIRNAAAMKHCRKPWEAQRRVLNDCFDDTASQNTAGKI